MTGPGLWAQRHLRRKCGFPQGKRRQNPANFGPKIQRKMCQFSTIYTSSSRAWYFSTEKNGLFFQRKILQKNAPRLGSEGGATDNSWRGRNSFENFCCRWGLAMIGPQVVWERFEWSPSGHPKKWVSFPGSFCLGCGNARPYSFSWLLHVHHSPTCERACKRYMHVILGNYEI